MLVAVVQQLDLRPISLVVAAAAAVVVGTVQHQQQLLQPLVQCVQMLGGCLRGCLVALHLPWPPFQPCTESARPADSGAGCMLPAPPASVDQSLRSKCAFIA